MTAHLKIFLFAALLCVGNLSATTVQKLKPQQYQPEIASLVTTFLNYYHYAKYDIDDRVSKRLLAEYLDQLDPNRMFFLASDIKDFQRFELLLDDHLNGTPVSLEVPFYIFNRYKKRVHERIDVILDVLKQEHDFEKEEYFAYDRSEEPWAKDATELNDVWRRRLKEDMVRFRLRDKPEKEYLDLLNKRYERLQKSVDEYEAPDVLERYLASLSATFDPHSSYLKPATKDNFDIQMGHSLEGIGATLTRDGEYTKVVDIVEGGPADLGGQLKVNDKIIAVAQGDEEPEDVVDLRLDKVVKKIRGPKGSTVRLTVIPGKATDQAETKEIAIVRDRVEITQADAKAEIHRIEAEDGQAYRVGVIEIPSFYMDSRAKANGDPQYKSTTRDVQALIKDLEKKNVDGLVIDLRENGGGSLDEAIRLSGLFITDGPVVQIKDHRGRVRVEDDPDPNQIYDGPLVVLTSVFSASASEIFASAIQDYERGVVVGSKSTHGKGTVQNVIDLQSSLNGMLRKQFADDLAGALKITTHKFYRVSGGSTQFKGVSPDIILPSPYDGLDVTEDSLDFALPWDEIKQANYKPVNQVGNVLPFLKSNSGKRIAQNPEFRYIKEDLAYREELEKKNRISLQLAQRIKEKEDLDARQKSRDEERKLRKPISTVEWASKPEPKKDESEEADEDEVVIPDFVLHEALLVMRDYVGVKGNRIANVLEKKESL